MARDRPARQRVLERSKVHLQDTAGAVRAVAEELAGLEPKDRVALAQEVRTLGDRITELTARDLGRLDGQLKIGRSPEAPRLDLKAAGHELSQLGTSLAQVGLSLDRASLQVGTSTRAARREDSRSFRLFAFGTEVGNEGFEISHLARQLLLLGDEQLRFLRTLLDQGPRPKRKERPPQKRGRPADARADPVWGGIESEDLVRRNRRKSAMGEDRRRSPKRVLDFSSEG